MSTPGPHLRVSDADREQVADLLRAHHAAGRLSVDELEERLSAAFAARTVADLAQLVHDLPGGLQLDPAAAAPAAPATAPARVKTGAPGLRSFRQDHDLAVDRRFAYRQALTDIVPVMVGAGYNLVSHVDDELLTFQREDRPFWVWLLCVLLFPIGLFALMVKERSRVVVTFKEAGAGRTRLVVQGTARRPVRRAFAELAA